MAPVVVDAQLGGSVRCQFVGQRDFECGSAWCVRHAQLGISRSWEHREGTNTHSVLGGGSICKGDDTSEKSHLWSPSQRQRRGEVGGSADDLAHIAQLGHGLAADGGLANYNFVFGGARRLRSSGVVVAREAMAVQRDQRAAKGANSHRTCWFETCEHSAFT